MSISWSAAALLKAVESAEARLVGVRQFDEETMLEHALALFWRQGVAATSMLDLAAATGVQRGSLYNAYGDKEAIFLRAFDLYAERFLWMAPKPVLREMIPIGCSTGSSRRSSPT